MTVRRSIAPGATLALPFCFLLTACGGGGTSVATIPPPPPPPPPTAQSFEVKLADLGSPATRKGSYGLIGILLHSDVNGPVSTRAIAPGEFTMTAERLFDDDPLKYTLKASAGLLPAGLTLLSVDQPFRSWTFAIPGSSSVHYDNEPRGEYCCQFLGQRLTAFSKAADGSETQILSNDLTEATSARQTFTSGNSNVAADLLYDIGYSYVAMGEWSWSVVDLNGNASGESGQLLFVNGDRTPASGIPASGTATYNARTLLGWVTVPFALTADFGQQIISTRIDQDYAYNSQGDIMDNPLSAGIHVAGSAPFDSNGSFDIPLSGTANYSGGYDINTPQPPPAEPVTGSMDGAFFGPHAEQVGGVLELERADGRSMLQDAFVGQQQPH